VYPRALGFRELVRVFSNTAISLDGRIATTARDHVQVGSDTDRRRMSHLRAQADAVLVGGQTFRSWPHPLVELSEDRVERSRPIINAVLTRTGIGHPPLGEWSNAELLVLASEEAEVEGLGEIEHITRSDPSPGWALDVLAARGCKSVLVEGGGDLIFQLLEQGRLDELFITLCPRIIGGVGAPSLADGVGFDAAHTQGLELLKSEVLGDEIYLHYRTRSGR
jgi:5-amino-6-(5-phosphoribosylamino)uracil reductase